MRSLPRASVRRWVALGAVLVISALLVGCCCNQRINLGPSHRFPPASALILPDPAEVHSPSDTVTEAAMRNVLLHLDDDIRMGVRELRGRMHDLSGHHVVVLDDKNTLMLEMTSGITYMTDHDLTLLLNRYVFGYPGSPLRNLTVEASGGQLIQRGTMHKIVDIPFEMTASLSVTDDGKIRIHPTRMDICGIDGKGLMRAVGTDLQHLLDLSGAKGVRVQGNDMLLDPLVILPPPKIEGRLTAVRGEGHNVVQVFGNPADAAPLAPAVAARNYAYFRGGTIRFGKLYMVEADLEAIDADEGDPFDFYLDYYHSQLVAGYHVTRPDYALVAYMPDFDDLGTAAGRPSPPPVSHR
jgi:hypothetical protein